MFAKSTIVYLSVGSVLLVGTIKQYMTSQPNDNLVSPPSIKADGDSSWYHAAPGVEFVNENPHVEDCREVPETPKTIVLPPRAPAPRTIQFASSGETNVRRRVSHKPAFFCGTPCAEVAEDVPVFTHRKVKPGVKVNTRAVTQESSAVCGRLLKRLG